MRTGCTVQKGAQVMGHGSSGGDVRAYHHHHHHCCISLIVSFSSSIVSFCSLCSFCSSSFRLRSSLTSRHSSIHRVARNYKARCTQRSITSLQCLAVVHASHGHVPAFACCSHASNRKLLRQSPAYVCDCKLATALLKPKTLLLHSAVVCMEGKA